MVTKAVRFNEQDDKAIKDFLNKNPIFDFSTLARLAIVSFIEKPKIDLKASTISKQKKVGRTHESTN